MLVDRLQSHDDLLLAGSDDEPEEALTEAERASEFSDWHFDRLEREANLWERVQ